MEWWKQKYLVLKIMFKYAYLKLIQNIYITVSHLHKNTYEIQYVLHDKIYKIRTNVRRGPSKIIYILDDLDRDITDEVRSYMGPNEDFHGNKMCPRDIGYELIYVVLRNDQQIMFKKDEPIVLP